ncbi:MAG: diaminopimelate epimerase [Candidatus Marinimicrobia bacterium]|nr:diaminopimelate epimerase [Candidatus Neomarinimicrobiota bacterium]
MIEINFWKVQACGNDFIMIDNMQEALSGEFFKKITPFLCDRRFGIGADGVIFINKAEGFDYEMRYYNSDGSGPVMCGNGGRASVLFVFEKPIVRKKCYKFLSIDGEHTGIYSNRAVSVTVRGGEVECLDNEREKIFFVNTGVPHIVIVKDEIDNIDIDEYAQGFRRKYDANVNLIEREKLSHWKIRTYERGVEGETYSCGTGTVASALVVSRIFNENFPIRLKALGGDLEVDFIDDQYWLSGEVKKVFEGKITCEV